MSSSPPNRRRELLFQYRTEVTQAYRAATAAGVALPVVGLVDTQDLDGRRIVGTAPAVPGIPQLPAPLVLVAIPLARLLAADSPLPRAWRAVLEKVTGAGGGPDFHIVMVIADESCFIIPVPLMA